MKRCIIIGCPGSGKTTFAEKLKAAMKELNMKALQLGRNYKA